MEDGTGTTPSAALAMGQGAYYAVTGVWPLLSIRTFELVTGPKTDDWLVKSMGAMLGVLGGALALAGARRRVTPELALLAAGNAAAFIAVDVHYVRRGRISPVYLLDAAVEAALLAGWGCARALRA